MWLNHDQPQAVAQFYSEEPAKRGMTVLNSCCMITARSLAGSKITGRRRAPGRSVGAFDFCRGLGAAGRVMWPRNAFLLRLSSPHGLPAYWLAAFFRYALAGGFTGVYWPGVYPHRPSVVAINRYLPPPGDNILWKALPGERVTVSEGAAFGADRGRNS
jgi:hypothetical protein